MELRNSSQCYYGKFNSGLLALQAIDGNVSVGLTFLPLEIPVMTQYLFI